MRILSGADNILNNLENNRGNLQTLTSQLASGLRIQSAVDDPSGYSISTSLKNKASGLQQAAENVQNGTNMLNVADNAAASIQQILQRINSLIVEASSDINSDQQLSAIQNEIEQMLKEINTIAGNANFNGLKLFDGSHDTYVAPAQGSPGYAMQVVEINPGLNPDGSTPTSDSVTNPDYSTGLTSAQLVSGVTENLSIDPPVTGLLIFQVTGYSSNPSDPVNGSLGQPGVYVRTVEYSTDTAFANGNGTESVFTQALWTNEGANLNGITGTTAPVSQSVPSGANAYVFNIQNLSASDVGVAIGYEVLAPQQSGGGTAIQINDGGQEGQVVSVSLPTLSTGALQVGDISVLRPTQVDGYDSNFGNLGTATGVDSSNQYATMDAQARVQQALQAIADLRATLGSEMVATQGDAQNAVSEAVNMTASASNIADLSIGPAVTEFTREQILNSVGTSILSQFNFDQQTIAHELITALIL